MKTGILFSDKETFTKVRPTKIPEKQLKEFYEKIAKEIVDNNWCDTNEDIETIIEDIEGLSIGFDTGYELARDLDDRGNANYEIDSDFIQFLEDLEWERRRVLEGLVKQWVSIHNPQPKYKKGDGLIIKIDLNYKLKFGQLIYITGIKNDTAEYLVHENQNNNGGYVCNFERVESSCYPMEELI